MNNKIEDPQQSQLYSINSQNSHKIKLQAYSTQFLSNAYLFLKKLTKSFTFVACITLLTYTPHVSMANPQGASVISGAISINTTDNATTITQASDKAVINWQSFDIDTNEITQFHQPSASAIALNRITNGNPTSILGQLKANGRLFLINPAGILFGASAKVDVAGLLATTADIHNQDFLAGHYRFIQANPHIGKVINQGAITAAEKGLVALVAPQVENTGIITARLGKVSLAAGNEYTLDLYGDQLINFAVSSESDNPQITHSGTIYADGGTVQLTANAASHVVNNVVNMKGVIEAKSIQQVGGKIILSGGKGGIVKVNGKLTATGKNVGEKGGTVQVLGQHIQLNEATIDTSGYNGGGIILVGGDYQGSGLTPRALTTYVDANTLLTANALAQGNGGKVIVWSDTLTHFAGRIFAQGGLQGGNGGLIETSSKKILDIAPTVAVNAQAFFGQAGYWILDPADITIDSTLANTIATSLATTNVSMNTDGSGGNGDIFVNSSINWAGNSSLTLLAHNNITIASGVTLQNTTGNGNVILHADIDATNGGTVQFADSTAKVNVNNGKAKIYYNPTTFGTATDFSNNFVTTGTGTLTAYQLVNNTSDLQNIGANSTNLSGNYALNTNLNLNGVTFTPIGNASTPFTGNFDGMNYVDGTNYSISNLTLSLSGQTNVGLFGVAAGSNTTLENLTLANLTITSGTNVGGLIGSSTTAKTLQNITIQSGNITASTGNVGGLIGTTSNGITVANVTNSAQVTGNSSGSIVGGVISGGTFTNIINNGNIGTNNNGSNAGGLVGALSGGNTTVINATNNGTITGSGVSNIGSIGGILGGIDFNTTASIQSSTNNGTISGGTGTGVGGIIGYTNGAVTISNNTSNLASISGATAVGGLIGKSTAVATVSSSSNTGNITATTTEAGGLIGTSGPDNTTQTTTIQNSTNYGNVTSPSYVGGLIGLTTPFPFSGFGQVSISNSQNYGNIGSTSSRDVGGLVGQLGGVNRNSTITSSSNYGIITGSSSSSMDAYAGGLVGVVYGNFTISDSTNFSSGSVSGYSYLGGLVGIQASNNTLTINNSINQANINGTAIVGGIVGSGTAGNITISSSSNTGNITATSSQAGGLIGTSGPDNTTQTTTIQNSTNYGNVNSPLYVGGLIGLTTPFPFSGFGQVSISNSQNYGQIGSTSSRYVGGLVGQLGGLNRNSTITSSDNHGVITGSTSSAADTYAGGLVGVVYGNLSISDSTNFSSGSVSGYSNLGGLVGLQASDILTINNSINQATITGTTILGGLAGSTSGGASFSQSSNSGNVTGSGGIFGGIVGFSQGSGTITFTDVINSGLVTGSGGNSGGFFGLIGNGSSLTVNLTNILNTGDINSSFSSIGGIIGGLGTGNGVTLTNSINRANVTGSSGSVAVGGLVGFNASNSLTISNSSSQNPIAGGTYAISGTSRIGGLIGYSATGATINNNSYNQATVSGTNQVGGLIGLSNSNVNISSSYNSGNVSGNLSGEGNGGIIGFSQGSGILTLTDVSNSGLVSGGAGNNGGIFGIINNWASLTVNLTNLLNTGNISANSASIGGLIGGLGIGNTLTMTNSINRGNVTGASGSVSVGGLIGNNTSSSLTISNSSNQNPTNGGTTTISGTNWVGGLVGFSFSGITISNSYNQALVNGTTQVGGLIGYGISNVNISSSYNSGNVTGGSGIIGGILGQLAGSGTITLNSLSNSGTIFSSGGNTSGIVGLVQTGGHTVTVTNVTNIGNVTGNNQSVGGIFGGIVPGNTISISNSSNYGNISTTISAGGLIGVANSPVSISSSQNYGNISASNMQAGGILANTGAGSSTSTFSNVFNYGNVISINNDSGGIIGIVAGNNGVINIQDSANLGNITGTSATSRSIGGFIGGATSTGSISITRSTNQGNIKADQSIGGFIGLTIRPTTLTNVVNHGAIIGNSAVGGLVGDIVTLINATNALSTGFVSPTASSGGLAGRALSGGIGFTNSYWDIQTSGQSTSVGTGSLSGKTTAQLMDSSTYTSWDLSASGNTTWRYITDGTATGSLSYPYLRSTYSTEPVVISGTASGIGGNVQVDLAANGNIITASSTQQTPAIRTGANGYFYALLPSTSLTANTPVLAYLSTTASGTSPNTTKGNTAFIYIGPTIGKSLIANTLFISDNNLTTANLNTIKGSLSDSDILFNTGSPLTATNTTTILQGPNALTAWQLLGVDQGTINNGNLSYSGFQNLVSGTAVDTFHVHDGASITGRLVDTGSIDTLDYSQYSSPVTVNFNDLSATAIFSGQTNGFYAIENFLGGSNSDTVIGTNAASNTWTLTGPTAGNLNNTFTFSNFENLTGSATYSDTLIPLNTTNNWVLTGNQSGSLNNVLNFSQFDTLTGGTGLDTLTGPNITNTWSITSTDAGNLNNNTLTFSSMEHLIGGTGSDTLNYSGYANPLNLTISSPDGGSGTGLTNGFDSIETIIGSNFDDIFNFTDISFIDIGSLSGTLSGGAGNDTLNYSGYANPLNLTISSPDSGSGTGLTNGFDSIETIIGSTLDDTFNLTNTGSLSGTLSGGTGSDILNYSGYTNPLSLTISSPDGGSGTGLTNGFDSIETIIGSHFDDAFNFSNTGSLSGTLTGGTGSDTLNYSGYTNPLSLTITNLDDGSGTGLTNGFDSIETIIGSNLDDAFNFSNTGSLSGTLSGGTGNDTLNYSGYTNPLNLTISSPDSGSGTGLTNGFDSIETIIGSNFDDTFNFTNTGSLSGTLTGGTGSDTLNYSRYTNPLSLTISSPDGGSGTGLTNGFDSIETIIGSNHDDAFNFTDTGSLSGTLTGGNGSDTLDFTLYDSPINITITHNNSGSGTGFSHGFTEIENIIGSSYDDIFTFADNASLDGNLIGGDGVDTINYSSFDETTDTNFLDTDPNSIDTIIGNDDDLIFLDEIDSSPFNSSTDHDNLAADNSNSSQNITDTAISNTILSSQETSSVTKAFENLLTSSATQLMKQLQLDDGYSTAALKAIFGVNSYLTAIDTLKMANNFSAKNLKVESVAAITIVASIVGINLLAAFSLGSLGSSALGASLGASLGTGISSTSASLAGKFHSYRAHLNPHSLTDSSIPRLPVILSKKMSSNNQQGIYLLGSNTQFMLSLKTPIHTDQVVGKVTAQVLSHIFDSQTHHHLLIPEGTNFLGLYYIDHQKLIINWYQAILPSTKVINFSTVNIEQLTHQELLNPLYHDTIAVITESVAQPIISQGSILIAKLNSNFHLKETFLTATSTDNKLI